MWCRAICMYAKVALFLRQGVAPSLLSRCLVIFWQVMDLSEALVLKATGEELKTGHLWEETSVVMIDM